MENTNPMSFGEKLIRKRGTAGVNPEDRLINTTVSILNELDTMREIATDTEQKRLVALAITKFEEAFMWAFKAAMTGK